MDTAIGMALSAMLLTLALAFEVRGLRRRIRELEAIVDPES